MGEREGPGGARTRRHARRILRLDVRGKELTSAADAAIRRDRESVFVLGRGITEVSTGAARIEFNARGRQQDDHATRSGTTTCALIARTGLFTTTTVTAIGLDAPAWANDDRTKCLDDQDATATTATAALVVVDEARGVDRTVRRRS